MEKNLSEGHKGKKLSEITKQKLRLAMKGNKYSLGHRHTEETKRKIGEASKGNKYKQGIPPWNKGLKLGYNQKQADKMRGRKSSEETKKKISNSLKDFYENNRYRPNKNKGKKYKEIYGDRWEEEIKKRSLSHIKLWDKKGRKVYKRPKHEGVEYRLWRKAVFRRDDYTCVWCGSRSGNGKTIILNADHIKSFSKFPELRLDINNGRTLCVKCHRKTDNYGWKTRII